MGRLLNGILGPFTGTVATVIGSSRRGIPYTKGRHRARTKNVSESELQNRYKFKVAQAWLKPLVDVVRLGFKNYSAKSQGFVSAKSYLYKHVLKEEDGTVIIDPSLMKVSFGSLPISENAAVSITGPYELTFTWDADSVPAKYKMDQVLMAAYNIGEANVSCVLTGQFRSVGKDILPLSQEYKPGATLHVYIAFIAADRSRQSDSVYLGEVIF